MRVDTANRSFAALLGFSLFAGAFIFCAAVGCVLAVLVASQVAAHGLDALGASSYWLATAFIAIVGGGVALGARSVRGQISASLRLSRHVRELELPLPPQLTAAASRIGLAGRVAFVDSIESFSFAYGPLTPRVAVSRGLVEATSPGELAAVLEHELYHVRNLDPLKVLLARAASAAFFYLPAVRALQSHYIAGRELAADRRAVETCGKKPLAGALLKVVRGPRWSELQTAAAIGGSELLDVRLGQLESGTAPSVSTLTTRTLLLSAFGGALLMGLFIGSVEAFGGPSAVALATGAALTPLGIAGVLLCAVPWAVGAWLGYRWLARRTRRPLDTTVT